MLIILPRQARDKHREKQHSKKSNVFLQLSGMLTDAPGGRPGTIKQLTLVPEQGTSSTAGWIENPCGYVR
jgi:hypothetical protein